MNYSELVLSSFWRADNILSQGALDGLYYPWMTDEGSLTAALTEWSAGNFEVTVLDQSIAIPRWHEQRKLQRPLSRAALIRQVELKIYGEAVIYARSIIPLTLVIKGRNGLANLGRAPLGHLLFKDGDINISCREFAEFQYHGSTIPARRTPYDYQGSRVLVTELFLPTLEKWL